MTRKQTVAATEWLSETWLELRNGNGPERRAYFAGALDVLADLGLLTREKADEVLEQSKGCPGHGDFEAGRQWCGFGCDIRRAPTRDEEREAWIERW